MDFHAFKRSKALQSPVCLLGWNSKGTWVSVASGTQSSMNWSTHADASIRGSFEHCWPKLKQCPRESTAGPHLLCSRARTAFSPAQAAESTCCPPQWDRRGGARQRERLPSCTCSCCCVCMQGKGAAPAWCLCPALVSVPLGAAGKDWEWQGKDLALTITQPASESCGVTGYGHHPETSKPSPTGRAQKQSPAKADPCSS